MINMFIKLIALISGLITFISTSILLINILTPIVFSKHDITVSLVFSILGLFIFYIIMDYLTDLEESIDTSEKEVII